MLLLAMLSLNNADRELINALFFDGVSTRDYAARIGITPVSYTHLIERSSGLHCAQPGRQTPPTRSGRILSTESTGA